MEIRSCSESDYQEVYNLICELEATQFDPGLFQIAFNSKLNNINCLFLVAVENNSVIAFCGFTIDYHLHHAKKVAVIEELIVCSHHRGKGYGKQLLDRAIAIAKENNCDIIELTSGLDRDKAHEFYLKNGFTKSSFKFKKEL